MKSVETIRVVRRRVHPGAIGDGGAISQLSFSSEQQAADFLAGCADRAARGEIAAHQLHAITTAVAECMKQLKAQRDEQDRQNASRQIDELLGLNTGAALHFKRMLMPRRR